jgi:hypothetical protein
MPYRLSSQPSSTVKLADMLTTAGQFKFHRHHLHPSSIMADILNYWTITGIVIGLLVLLPSIMGFFGGNKFDVKGKVRVQPFNQCSLV